MVLSLFLITFSDSPVENPSTTVASATPMAFAGSGQLAHNSNQAQQAHRNRRLPNSPGAKRTTTPCHSSPISAAVDVVVLIVVLFACGYLAMPYLQLFYRGAVVAFRTVEHYFGEASMAIQCLRIAFPVVCITGFAIVLCMFGGRKCDNPNCLGLRDAPEFDIKIEKEECLKNSTCGSNGGDGMENCFFELSGDHHRELEAQLKKVAPPNGRAVLIFRARCGCSAGRMVVSGPKKPPKTKK